MSIALYEISDRIEYILANCVDEEDGTMTQQTADMLDSLEDAREEKILNILLYYKGELLESQAIQSEADKLKARADAHKDRAIWLKRYVELHLLCTEQIKDPRVNTSWRKGTAVEIEDEDKVPEAYWLSTVTERIDKIKAKQTLQASGGNTIPGLKLVTKNHLQIK